MLATTREIAQSADLNEATLFRHFLHKPDLFWVAVESRLGRVKLGRDLQMSLAGDEEPSVRAPRNCCVPPAQPGGTTRIVRLLHVAAFELPGAEKVIREHLGPNLRRGERVFRWCARTSQASFPG